VAAKGVAEQPLVVVLAENQRKGIATQLAPDVSQRKPRRAPPSRPHVGLGGAFAELECKLGDAELRTNLQRARLHTKRARLHRGTRVSIDDEGRTSRRAN
jgi:hypothetical protein